MKITLIAIGKTDDIALQGLIDIYKNRLQHYVNFEVDVIQDVKSTKKMSEEQQKTLEGQMVLKKLQNSDFVALLDENGRQFTSVKFSGYLQKRMNSGLKNLIFIIGGPYGFSKDLYDRSNSTLSLSPMTFSHQMVRLFFIEQLYRGFTILRNEPYHHR